MSFVMMLDNGNSEEDRSTHQPHRHMEDTMQTITMDMTEAHDFATYSDAETVASQWQGAEVQQVTYNGLNPDSRTVWNVMLPVPSRDYRMGFVAMRGF